MYFLIADSPIGNYIVGHYNTKEDAQDKLHELYNDYCNYYITKVVQ